MILLLGWAAIGLGSIGCRGSNKIIRRAGPDLTESVSILREAGQSIQSLYPPFLYHCLPLFRQSFLPLRFEEAFSGHVKEPVDGTKMKQFKIYSFDVILLLVLKDRTQSGRCGRVLVPL